MKRTHILNIVLMLALVYPAGLFAQDMDAETAEEAGTAVSPEAAPSLNPRAKLFTGLSMSILGGGLTILGELYRIPFQQARDSYNTEEILSVAEIEARRAELQKTSLLHFIPFYSGLALSGLGIYITLEGAFTVNIYDYGPYAPKIEASSTVSGVSLSPAFTGFVIRY